MKEREVDRLLAGLEPASPPPGTRDRALAAARAARAHGTKPGDLWTRLWRSRPARLAWAAAVAALLLAHVVVTVERSPQRGPSHTPAALASLDESKTELVAIAELPPLRLDVTPAADIFQGLPAAGDKPSQPSPRRPS